MSDAKDKLREEVLKITGDDPRAPVMTDNIMSLIAAHDKALLDRVKTEVIGENEPLAGLTGTIKTAYNNKNLLRNEQRAALDKLIKEME